MAEMIYENESYKIMGACFEVYKEMGCGFLEPVYQECLQLELASQGIPFRPQIELALHYKGKPLACPNSVCVGKRQEPPEQERRPTTKHTKHTKKNGRRIVELLGTLALSRPSWKPRRTRVRRPRNKRSDRLSCSEDVPYRREQLTKRNKAGGNSFAPAQMIFNMPGHGGWSVRNQRQRARVGLVKLTREATRGCCQRTPDRLTMPEVCVATPPCPPFARGGNSWRAAQQNRQCASALSTRSGPAFQHPTLGGGASTTRTESGISPVYRPFNTPPWGAARAPVRLGRGVHPSKSSALRGENANLYAKLAWFNRGLHPRHTSPKRKRVYPEPSLALRATVAAGTSTQSVTQATKRNVRSVPPDGLVLIATKEVPAFNVPLRDRRGSDRGEVPTGPSPNPSILGMLPSAGRPGLPGCESGMKIGLNWLAARGCNVRMAAG